MHDNVSAIMLAGTIIPTPFQEALGIPVLCLPIGRSGTALTQWRHALATVNGLADVQVVVKSPKELAAVSAAVNAGGGDRRAPALRPMREPGAWRGVAGLVHDLSESLAPDAVVLVCEAHCQPPQSLDALMGALTGDTAGVVGTAQSGEPAGIYAFRRSAFDCVNDIGYCDLKEQLLPLLYQGRQKVVARQVSSRVRRMRDLASYLDAVRHSLLTDDDAPVAARVSPRAAVSRTAVLEGFCVIESGVEVADGAVVHDSVLLSGAVVGGGAVVSRSVVGPMVQVKARAQIVRQTVASPLHLTQDMLELIEEAAGSTSAA